MAKIKERIDDFKPDERLLDDRGATAERLKRSEGYHDKGDTGITSVRDAPLERAHIRKIISEHQYQAGLKFRVHWFHAGLAANLQSVDLNRVFASDPGSASGMARTEKQAFHRQQYRRAVDVTGLRGSWVVQEIACHDTALDDVGYKLGWKNRPQAMAAALELLRDGLDRLCREWGIG